MDYPLKHLSIRVPWHDQKWNGHVCSAPTRNTACLRLKNISLKKDDAGEEAVAGSILTDLAEDRLPPCARERAVFMASFAMTLHHSHPYTESSPKSHSHFLPTPLHYPAYSAGALPFRWMQKDFVWGSKKERGLVEDFWLPQLSQEREPTLSFDTSWVQEADNHRELLNCFWNHIRPQESLVFFYAKQVPLTDEQARRIIIGVGKVKDLGPLTEYKYAKASGPGAIRSLLWERMVSHSIRPDSKDGFLLPYHEALAKAEAEPEFDPAQVVAFAPQDRFVEFSYASEHVSSDGALASLLEIHDALKRAAGCLDKSFSRELDWVEKEISRLWKQRGPCPGLGAVLGAMGIRFGSFVANSIVEKTGTKEDPWSLVEETVSNPDTHLPPELARNIDSIIAKSWNRQDSDRQAFVKLLSRFDMTLDQAKALYDTESREEKGIDHTDREYVENPYLLYEATRQLPRELQISVETIDRGVFPADIVRNNAPLPSPSALKSGLDGRRVRALTISRLEHHATQGHTLQPRKTILSEIREMAIDPKCEVTADIMDVVEDENFGDAIARIRLPDESFAYQLRRLSDCAALIRRTVEKRLKAPKHEIFTDWEKILEAEDLLGPVESGDIQEKRARIEKVAALNVIAGSRLSVLIGSAGTGKTTLLRALAKDPDIAKGGILLLAPTGKARVRMEEGIGKGKFPAKTIAQFLNRTGRYDATGRGYFITGRKGENDTGTVIIDECSMLTDEMLAATLEALGRYKRLILMGDYRQLPPIGPGKPFFDIVERLRPENSESVFPRASLENGFAELTISRRFTEAPQGRDDLRLAGWFDGSKTPAGDDEILDLINGRRRSEHIEIRRWSSIDELHEQVVDSLAQEIPGEGELDGSRFALSLGAQEHNGYFYFNEGCGKAADAWQILTPVRQHGWGVEEINRLLHNRYMASFLELARKTRYRKIPKPMGSEQIVYGNKVINNHNHQRWFWARGGENEKSMLANGEIGMAVGKFKRKEDSKAPSVLEIEFSSQPGCHFKFFDNDFSEESQATLELAYALTVHRAQGSEFKKVFLILPKNRRMVTREMLYTALTRQVDKIVLFSESNPFELLELRHDRYSETKTRFTNLFKVPDPKEFEGRYLDANLIHQTAKGELVRSKSEVIIADHLFHRGIDFRYEKPIELGDDIRIPDFTIEDDDMGITYYWEHCGMLNDPTYKRRWDQKKTLYRQHGILPHEEGGGPKGILIQTHDDSAGGISSKAISDLIDELFD